MAVFFRGAPVVQKAPTMPRTLPYRFLENYDSAGFYRSIGSLDFVKGLGSQHGITKEKTKGVISYVESILQEGNL